MHYQIFYNWFSVDNWHVLTGVTANLITGCLDPEAYPEPEKFKPDRFLGKDGAFIHPDKMYYAPFGAG